MSTVGVISYRQPVEGCYILAIAGPGGLRGAHATARIYHALGWNRARLAGRGRCTKGANPDWVFGRRCRRITASSARQIDDIKRGLRENGLIEDQDYVLDARFADGNYERFPELARELAQAGARVILVNTIASVRAAQNLNPPVAVVMLAINDPVGSGLVASLARPGGYTTGTASLMEDLTPKLIEFQREVIPKATTIAALFNPGNPTNPKFLANLQTAANPMGMQVLPFALKSPDELDSVFSTLVAQHPDTLQLVADSGTLDLMDRIAGLALAHRLPSFSTISGYARFGGLLAYGIDGRKVVRRAQFFVKGFWRVQNRATSRWSNRQRSSWPSILRQPKRLASAFPQRCFPAPTRSSSEVAYWHETDMPALLRNVRS